MKSTRALQHESAARQAGVCVFTSSRKEYSVWGNLVLEPHDQAIARAACQAAGSSSMLTSSACTQGTSANTAACLQPQR